jgi:hypothetical protein
MRLHPVPMFPHIFIFPVVAMKKRIYFPCIPPPHRCILIAIEPGFFGATREREPSLKAVIVRETHGHAHPNRAKQANGSHSRQEHKTRTPGEEDCSILWLQFPATRFQSARQTGPGFSSPAKSHFCPRLLLASPPGMLARTASEVEAAFLGSQAIGKPEARLAQHSKTSSPELERQCDLGMPAEK